MFSFIIVTFQLFFVLMIGIFYRSTSFQTMDTQFVTCGLVTILAFVLMSSTFRKLSLFSLLLLLFISFLTIQLNFLFMTFWSSCFTSFSKQIVLSTNLLVNSVYAALGVILTCMDFLGLFEYWQVFSIICLVMTIGFGLTSSVTIFGLDTFDGGNGISVFLFSGMCSLMIWLLSIRGKISILEHKKSQSYINYTLGFIGVALGLFSWPILNAGGSNITQINTDLTSSASLTNSAYINTLCGLGIPLIISSFLSSHETQSQKQNPKVYIECFINSGVIIATYNDVSLHPVVGMTLSLFCTIVTLLVDKYLVVKTTVRNQSDIKMVLMKFSKILFRILWSFVGVCIGAIVVRTRDQSSLWLLNNSSAHSTKAGLMILSWLICLVIGLVFGAICGLVINFYLSYRYSWTKEQKVTKVVDEFFFQDLESQIFPIYPDILQIQPNKTYEQDLTRRVLHQSLLMQQQLPTNIYQTNKKSNHQTNSGFETVQKETLVIKNDFSKSNLHRKEINLSAIKIPRKSKNQQPVAEESKHIKKSEIIKRQKIQPEYTPIKMLQASDAKLESRNPAQSQLNFPQQLKPISSSSKLAEIHIVEQDHPANQSEDHSDRPFPQKKLTFQEKVHSEDSQNKGVNPINS